MTPRHIATIGCYLVATVLAVGCITADVDESGWAYLLGAVLVASLGVGLQSEGKPSQNDWKPPGGSREIDPYYDAGPVTPMTEAEAREARERGR